MKAKVILLILLMTGAAALSGFAAERFGLGIILGEPTGLCAKLWFNRIVSLDFAAAWSFLDGQSFYLHLDMQYHFYGISDQVRTTAEIRQQMELPVYVGTGIKINLNENFFRTGLRVPVGINFIFHNVPLDVFLEVATGMNFYPAKKFTLNNKKYIK